MPRVACITLDMEPDYGDPDGRIRLLEEPEFRDRYVETINRHKVKLTMFTVTSLFDSFGERFRELARRIPLEYSSHSHSQNPYNACSREEIETAQRAFQEFTGSPPLGYRAPVGRMSREGLGHLLDIGCRYDASLYPSLRPGKFGYSNLHMPNSPFRVTRGRESLLELPFASLSTIRIVFALSYVKLVGWRAYSLLLKLFGLPDVVVALAHPYDFYTHWVADGLSGLEGFALKRNATRAFEYFENMILALEQRGYQFAFVSELCDQLEGLPDLREIALEAWPDGVG